MQTDPTARHSPIGLFRRVCYLARAQCLPGQPRHPRRVAPVISGHRRIDRRRLWRCSFASRNRGASRVSARGSPGWMPFGDNAQGGSARASGLTAQAASRPAEAVTARLTADPGDSGRRRRTALLPRDRRVAGPEVPKVARRAGGPSCPQDLGRPPSREAAAGPATPCRSHKETWVGCMVSCATLTRSAEITPRSTSLRRRALNASMMRTAS
jgi:hypothetical protein